MNSGFGQITEKKHLNKEVAQLLPTFFYMLEYQSADGVSKLFFINQGRIYAGF